MYICGLSPGISQAIGGLENGIGRTLRVGSLKNSLEGSIDVRLDRKKLKPRELT